MSSKAALTVLTTLVLSGLPRATSTALWNAVMWGDLGQVKALVEAGADVNEATSVSVGGMVDYPLQFAARLNHLEIAKYLISQGAQVNQARPSGHTPLLDACAGLHSEFVELLLQNGADVNAEVTPTYLPKFLLGLKC